MTSQTGFDKGGRHYSWSLALHCYQNFDNMIGLLNSNNQAPSVQKVDSAIGLRTTNLYQGQEKIDFFASYIFILLNLPRFRCLGGRFLTLPADFLAVYFPLGLSGPFMPVF